MIYGALINTVVVVTRHSLSTMRLLDFADDLALPVVKIFGCLEALTFYYETSRLCGRYSGSAA
jgi:hypothetical protein